MPKDGVPPHPDEKELCKICMDSAIDCVLLDCGHMVTCTKCGKQMNECPICRQYVVRAVHIFRAWIWINHFGFFYLLTFAIPDIIEDFLHQRYVFNQSVGDLSNSQTSYRGYTTRSHYINRRHAFYSRSCLPKISIYGETTWQYTVVRVLISVLLTCRQVN